MPIQRGIQRVDVKGFLNMAHSHEHMARVDVIACAWVFSSLFSPIQFNGAIEFNFKWQTNQYTRGDDDDCFHCFTHMFEGSFTTKKRSRKKGLAQQQQQRHEVKEEEKEESFPRDSHWDVKGVVIKVSPSSLFLSLSQPFASVSSQWGVSVINYLYWHTHVHTDTHIQTEAASRLGSTYRTIMSPHISESLAPLCVKGLCMWERRGKRHSLSEEHCILLILLSVCESICLGFQHCTIPPELSLSSLPAPDDKPHFREETWIDTLTRPQFNVYVSFSSHLLSRPKKTGICSSLFMREKTHTHIHTGQR